MPRPVSVKLAASLIFVAMNVLAQTNEVASTNKPIEIPSPGKIQGQTNQDLFVAQDIEAIRMDCIQNRRMICGKILKVLPDGLVVDSGYTDLSRAPLNSSWLVPGTVVVARASNLVENNQPDSPCIGLVFLTDLPKLKARNAKPKLFDYVNIGVFPTGQYTYTSVGDVRRTVRKFSASLQRAVQWKLDENEKQNEPLK